jgi:hypothetical protein
MSTERFAATDPTSERWRKRQWGSLLVSVGFVALVVIEVLSIRDDTMKIVGVVATALICAAAFTYLAYMGSPHRLRTGTKWAGYGNLSLFALREANLDHEVRSTSDRRLRFWTQNRGAIGGRMEVLASGLRWSIGPISRLAGVSGEVFIPWTSIMKVEVGTVPGTIVRKSGGGISVTLNDGHQLDGHFIGAKGDLVRVLDGLSLGGEAF